MYDVYGGKFTRTGLVLMLLDYAGIEYRLHAIDTVGGEHRTPEFLAINPAGYVPALRTPEGQILHETPAIMLYLAERHRLDAIAPPVGDPDRAEFLSGLFYCADDIQPEIKRYYYPSRFAPDEAGTQAIHAQARANLVDRLSVVSRRLEAGGPYYLGERLTLVDLTVVFWATSVHPQADLYRDCPGLASYRSRVLAWHPCTRHIDAHEASSREYWASHLG